MDYNQRSKKEARIIRFMINNVVYQFEKQLYLHDKSKIAISVGKIQSRLKEIYKTIENNNIEQETLPARVSKKSMFSRSNSPYYK